MNPMFFCVQSISLPWELQAKPIQTSHVLLLIWQAGAKQVKGEKVFENHSHNSIYKL